MVAPLPQLLMAMYVLYATPGTSLSRDTSALRFVRVLFRKVIENFGPGSTEGR
jgi:hypothetical protein